MLEPLIQLLNQHPTCYNVCLSKAEGGLELFAVDCAKQQQAMGYKPVIICLPQTLIHRRAQQSGLPVHLLKSKTWIFRFLELNRFLLSEKASLIFCHRSQGLKMSLPYKLISRKTQIISFVHMMLSYKKKDIFHRFIFSKVSLFVVFSLIQESNFRKYTRVSKERIQIMSHKIERQRFYPADKVASKVKLGINSSIPTIGCIGRFDPQKGQLDLIQAAHRLKQQGLNFQLLMVGQDTKNEPGSLAKCKEETRKLGLDQTVSFFEHSDRIEEVYRAIDLFVMPSHQETFGLALIEAMASGCLCVAARAGGPIEILDEGRAGILFEPRSVNDLSQKLELVLRNPQDYKLLQEHSLRHAQQHYSA